MVNLKCNHCQSENLVRNGKPTTANNAICARIAAKWAATPPQPNGYTEQEREQILRAYEERSSLRGLTRTFGVARNTVTSWLKEKKTNARFVWETGRAEAGETNLGTRRVMVVRCQKSPQTLDMDCSMSAHQLALSPMLPEIGQSKLVKDYGRRFRPSFARGICFQISGKPTSRFCRLSSIRQSGKNREKRLTSRDGTIRCGSD